ncbi:MAG: glycosyltransferase family 2 protein [Bacteroidia bacterium]
MIEKLSIIIPVFNEAQTIEQVLEKVKSVKLIHNISKQVIIIDDHSKDNSLEVIRKFASKNSDLISEVISLKENKGKGFAVRTGISFATGNYIIIQDADVELNPEDYNVLIQASVKTNAQVVYGSRFLKRQKFPIPIKTVIANKILSAVTSVLVGKKITDMETCYKLIDRSLLQDLQLKENRFGFEPEITLKLLRKRHIRYVEVPVSYKARSKHMGKKIGLTDGLRALYCLIRYRLS